MCSGWTIATCPPPRLHCSTCVTSAVVTFKPQQALPISFAMILVPVYALVRVRMLQSRYSTQDMVLIKRAASEEGGLESEEEVS